MPERALEGSTSPSESDRLFVDGQLAAPDATMRFLARPRFSTARAHGLNMSDLQGGDHRIPATCVGLRRQATQLDAEAVLVDLKSGARDECPEQSCVRDNQAMQLAANRLDNGRLEAA